MRTYRYEVIVECASAGEPDWVRLEHLKDLHASELIEDEEFIAALGETESVSITTTELRKLS